MKSLALTFLLLMLAQTGSAQQCVVAGQNLQHRVRVRAARPFYVTSWARESAARLSGRAANVHIKEYLEFEGRTTIDELQLAHTQPFESHGVLRFAHLTPGAFERPVVRGDQLVAGLRGANFVTERLSIPCSALSLTSDVQTEVRTFGRTPVRLAFQCLDPEQNAGIALAME